MIRVTTIYPKLGEEDFEKYKEEILPIIIKKLKPLKVEIDKGIDDLFDNPPIYSSIGINWIGCYTCFYINYSCEN